MWLFTPAGFFSAVAHREKPSTLLVRARARADLERLVTMLPTKAKPPITHTPRADYPYRIELSRAAFAKLTASMVEALTYDNFKGAAMQTGAFRWAALHEVWEAMRSQHEDANARNERSR